VLKLLSYFVVVGILTLSASAEGELAGGLLSSAVKRIVFLGDSITYSGEYIDYLDAFLRTRMPELHFELINLGLPSETVSGLTEPNHAGGAFPRPCLSERLDRVLAQAHPDLVVACYGMNDGIYYPFDEERFRRYREGIGQLVRAVRATGAQLLLLTPPTFDPLPIQKSTLPAGRTDYPSGSPYVGYDEVLGRYSRWLLDKRRLGWDVADVHGPMARHLLKRRRTSPDYRLAGDGVHTNAYGHWLIAEAVLRAWNTAAEADWMGLRLHHPETLPSSTGNPDVPPQDIRFTWHAHRLPPVDPAWDPRVIADERVMAHWYRLTVSVVGAPAPRYRLTVNDIDAGVVTREQLAHGVDIAPAVLRKGEDTQLLPLIRERQRLLTDAWLTAVGHQRPGMAHGLPLEEAQRQADALEAKITPLVAPVTIDIRLQPVARQ
jgi:lysophospholipase L1-like esterase